MAATNVTIEIDNTLITEAIDALCERGRYEAEWTDENDQLVQNPVTKAQFAKKQVAKMIYNVIVESRVETARLAVDLDDELIA
mgnify:CR=1 FL=1